MFYFQEHQISPGDFPDIKKMQEHLVNHDFTKFHALGIPAELLHSCAQCCGSGSIGSVGSVCFWAS
jgi:hypothetical protein